MQIADLDGSDPDVAGLMIKCIEHVPRAVLVLVDPVPPRTPAELEFAVGANRTTYPATPIPTGAGLLIAGDASSLFIDRWREDGMLNVTAHVASKTLTGRFFLRGLTAKLNVLRQSCLVERAE